MPEPNEPPKPMFCAVTPCDSETLEPKRSAFNRPVMLPNCPALTRVVSEPCVVIWLPETCCNAPRAVSGAALPTPLMRFAPAIA